MTSPPRPDSSGRSLVSCVTACLAGCAWLPASLLAARTASPQEPPPQSGHEAPAAPAPAPQTRREEPFLRGQLRSHYFVRWTGAQADNDLVETLVLDAGHADRDRVTGHLMGRLAWDIDGTDSTFASLSDAYGERVDALLYDAWIDLHEVSGCSLVRLGRQSIQETPEVAFFDGAHVASEEFGSLGLQFGGYGGVSTHLYESSRTGDLTAGAYAQLRPWSGGRLRVDYMHLEDETLLRSHDDDLLAAGFWQSLGTWLQIDGQYSRLGDRDRDVQGHALCRVPEWGLVVRGSYYLLLEPQGDLVLEADPFFNAMNELHPYDQWSVAVGDDVVKSLYLEGGADVRRVRETADIGFYNRDYDRYHATARWYDVLVTGLRLAGTFDYWDATEQTVSSGGGDVGYEFGATTASLGTFYSLYKFDLFSNSERDHVRTWFARLRHKTSAALVLECDYELEDNDFDQYHRLRLGATWNF